MFGFYEPKMFIYKKIKKNEFDRKTYTFFKKI